MLCYNRRLGDRTRSRLHGIHRRLGLSLRRAAMYNAQRVIVEHEGTRCHDVVEVDEAGVGGEGRGARGAGTHAMTPAAGKSNEATRRPSPRDVTRAFPPPEPTNSVLS